MTRMTPDHRGITSHLHLPSSSLLASRADSLDDYSADDCGLLRVYASSSSAKQQQQQLGDLSDACSTVSSTDTVVDVTSASPASSSFDFDLDLLDDCQVPSLELPFPELTDGKKEESDAVAADCKDFCAYEETLSSCCGLSPQQVGDYLWLVDSCTILISI